MADQLDVRLRGKGGIRHDDEHLRPERTAQAYQHLAKRRILRPIVGSIFSSDNREMHGHSVVAPREHHHDNVQPKDIGSIFIQAPLLGQRMLRASFIFQRTVRHDITHPILWRW
jgi:hypothetical protein